MDGAGGPEGGMGRPEGGGMGGLGWKGGPLGTGKSAEEDRCPVAPEGGPHGGPPKTGAGFTAFPQKVGRADAAGDPVCLVVCGEMGA